MIYYFDASALVKEYCYEKGTQVVVKLLNTKIKFFSSVVIYSEVLCALRKKQKDMRRNHFYKQRSIFEKHFYNLLNKIPINNDIFNFLKKITNQYSIKALDAIHLASALWTKENIDMNCKFICSDRDLLKFAEQERLDIINPEYI